MRTAKLSSLAVIIFAASASAAQAIDGLPTFKAGLSISFLSTPFLVVLTNLTTKAAKSAGLNWLQPVDAQSDPGKQISDIQTLRARAREHIADGAVTGTYEGDVKKTIELLQGALATEILCVLRYTMHSIAATGIASEGPKEEFAEHAREEEEHRS